MDIVFDPPGSGLFTEVYLYEELMEADLHAIVSLTPSFRTIQAETTDPVRTASFGRSLPIVPVPDPLRVEGADAVH